MNMALTQARGGQLYESRLLLHLGDLPASAIAHPRSQPADQLIDDPGQSPSVRNAALDPFRNQFLQGPVALRIAIAPAPFHGTDGAHATIYFIRASLVQNRLSGTLLRARKEAADHDRGGSARDGFRDVPRIFDPAICNDGDFGPSRR